MLNFKVSTCSNTNLCNKTNSKNKQKVKARDFKVCF